MWWCEVEAGGVPRLNGVVIRRACQQGQPASRRQAAPAAAPAAAAPAPCTVPGRPLTHRATTPGPIHLPSAHHHAKQRAVAVDEEAVLAEPRLCQRRQHTVDVIHRAPHRSPDVDVEDGGAAHVGGQVALERVVVNLPGGQGVHLRAAAAGGGG